LVSKNISKGVGFFQIGGGIGDFPFVLFQCYTKIWKCMTFLLELFLQISDSTTSYGSYSGAVPNERKNYLG
jgi:hypothetical protein